MAGERILLVEDEADTRRFLAQEVLRPAGYDVLTATDGAEGLALARDLQPDLVITTDRMPHLNGLDLLKALLDEGIKLPFILIPAAGCEALAVQALRLGISDYLNKPFEPEELLQVVQHVLDAHWSDRITEHIPAHLLEANRQLEQRLRDLDTLVRIGKQFTSSLDLGPVLDQVVEAAVQLAHAEEGTLMLVDKSSGELYLYASTSSMGQTNGSFRLPVSDSLAGQAVRTGQPIVITGEDLQKIKTHYLARDLAYFPLSLQDEVIGVLGVTNRETTGGFEPHIFQLLNVLADFAAIAIDNARLYHATEQERSTLDTILRDTEDVIIVVDLQNDLMFCNPAACRTFGLNQSEYFGLPLAEVIHDQQILQLFDREVRSGRSRSSEIVLDDGHGVLNAQLTIIEGVGQVVVMQDITHLKELDRIKSDFVTTVSHDLRSPLTAILGYIELLSRSGPLNDSQKQFVQRIIFSVQSITSLISNLLELGKIEAGFAQDREPISLSLIVRYAIEGLHHEWESKQQTLHIDLPETLLPVLGNPHRLRQMANNLLENAAKYTPAGGTINVSLHEDGGFLMLQVTDTGIGIPPQDQPHIFDKFYRSDQAIDEFVGTGLGLSIVKGVVDQHQGRIWVESQIGQGTTFTVMLPSHHSADHTT